MKKILITAEGCPACAKAEQEVEENSENGEIEKMEIGTAIKTLEGLVDCMRNNGGVIGVPVFAEVDDSDIVKTCNVGLTREGKENWNA